MAMTSTMLLRFKTIALLGIGVLCAPAFGADPDSASGANSARPGTVNYVEGAAYLDGNPLSEKNVGSVDLSAGEVLSTTTGRAEILLTPGVFLRIDNNSAVKMISPDIIPTQVEVERGRSAVEVDQLFPQNDLEIVDGGVTTQLQKPGFYEFNATQPTALVFKGKAAVNEGDGKYKEIKEHHEMTLAANGEAKSTSFDPRDAEDQFYNWSSLRSEYLAEANNQIAAEYAGVEGFNPGWYWDPYAWDYTFIGLGPYWSPFGFGFYPPWGWYGGYWGGRGFYGRGFYGGGFHGGGGVGGGGFHGGGGGGRR
jgi:hypothetical protein